MKLKHQRQSSGVSLVELLVVITIMMMMLSLVAPLTVDIVKKAEAQDEYLTFCRSLRKSAFDAFARGQSLDFRFDMNTVVVMRSGGISKRREYQYLSFAPQTFSINQNGFPTKPSIDIKLRKRDIHLDLIALIEGEL